MKKQNLQKRKAFSLVELAIVIIIIGLLIAGIMGGASLIKSATLRAVTTEASNYKVAVNAFHTKYNFYPGDYNQQLYGGAPLGNGDGRISIGTGTVGNDGGNTGVVESALAIGHLFTDNSLDASLFSGNSYDISTATYNSNVTFSPTTSDVNSKAPRGKITNSIWVIANDTADVHRNVIYLTRSFNTASGTLSGVLTTGILNYADMLAIDTMADDGDRDGGFVKERAECAVGETSQACSVSFDLEFFSAN